MRKYFNTEGICNPQEHYMVNLGKRMAMISQLIDRGKYFSINCGRQYGKTTTLAALKTYLQEDYLIASLDFQFLTQAAFRDEYTFSAAFAKRFVLSMRNMPEADGEAIEGIRKCAEDSKCSMATLFERLSDLCAVSPKPVILMIDEVDSASNYQVFLDFLALLRGYYLHRKEFPTFRSVILAGVYDIRNLKQKLRAESEHKNNSPWNIAAEFPVAMALDETGIEGMLAEYEADHHMGMDVQVMAELLYEETSGYPFLVSRLCQLMDERIPGSQDFPEKRDAWTRAGLLAAEKILLMEKNPLFESLTGKLEEYPELRRLLYAMLFSGKKAVYNPDNAAIDMANMLGFVRNESGNLAVANRIFETRLYNLFLSEEETTESFSSIAAADRNQFVKNGVLDMELLLEKFVLHWGDLYSAADERFIEENGRKFFLLYLKPVINGAGNYYIESRTRNQGRTDVIVDYHGRQYIVEIKIWRGEEYNRRGEEQLAAYLEDYHAQKGYLLSFNFNKHKVTGVREILCGDKVIYEAVV
ncbi:MAG: ATP-binding protein [Lachnospiraceae bacterium]|nr:ATP-binding protein [Lachnospiraceae bacterium]